MHDAHGFQSMDEAGIDQANASQDYKKCQKLAPVHISQHASTWSNHMCQPLAQWWLTARLACVAERHSSAHINCMRACAEATQTARHMQHRQQFGTSCTSLLRECAQQRFSLKPASQAPCVFSKNSAASKPTHALRLDCMPSSYAPQARHVAPSAAPAHDMSTHGYHSNGKVKSTQARAYVRSASHLHCKATTPSAPLARSAAAGTAAPSPYRA